MFYVRLRPSLKATISSRFVRSGFIVCVMWGRPEANSGRLIIFSERLRFLGGENTKIRVFRGSYGGSNFAVSKKQVRKKVSESEKDEIHHIIDVGDGDAVDMGFANNCYSN